MIIAKMMRVVGPTIHPSLEMLHANDNTPDPITAVTICADAVHTVPKHHNIYIKQANTYEHMLLNIV